MHKILSHIIIVLVLVSGFAAAEDDFEVIFDGETLDGWNAPDMSYWSVEDGAITAQSSEELPCTVNQFLVWQGGEVADFELRLQFRLENNAGNSGIQFRSELTPDGNTIGYQADILPGGEWLCALCDENTARETLVAPNGTKTVIAEDGTWTQTPLEEKGELKDPGEWNDYRVVARGHHITLEVNGRVCAEVIDNEPGEFDASGILALQLRSGDPMKVQFKDIQLRHITP